MWMILSVIWSRRFLRCNVSEYIEHDRDENTVGIVEKKFFTFAEPPDEMVLESGAKLGPITLAYETCGSLNADKSNVILILHALS